MRPSQFILLPLLALCFLITSSEGAPALKTKNVFLIVSDGFRWQEVFTGAEEALLDKTNGGVRNISATRKQFWRETPEARRDALLPFLWGDVAKHGQIFGNQKKGSVATVTNPHRFSYPGYNEMLTGFGDPKIDSNKKIPNPNVTVFEWLQKRTALEGKIAVFASWDVFPWIFNVERSGLPIWPVFDSNTKPQIQPPHAVQGLLRDTTPLWDDLIFDSFLYHAAADYIQSRKPRLLFLGFGETDEWAHEWRYDLYLQSAHHFDGFLRQLWQLAQSLPEYRDQTTFIITADHGRGSGPSEWKDHGKKTAGAEGIWLAVIGPDTPALGERTNTEPIAQSQIAETIAKFMGESFKAEFPKAAPAIGEAFGVR